MTEPTHMHAPAPVEPLDVHNQKLLDTLVARYSFSPTRADNRGVGIIKPGVIFAGVNPVNTDAVGAGDIGAAVGLKDAATGWWLRRQVRPRRQNQPIPPPARPIPASDRIVL